ncbi:unnamed protein product [Caenorhabditis nigoni]|uniref:SCP domain-containing protein n=1 Tax=Caenorhabditis nigoni TaxID=1611254 RepID=A0A2G5TVD0_9PELO|nr:hypothetical protein B9Z55_012025 [Caenorhabditis nigoni]
MKTLRKVSVISFLLSVFFFADQCLADEPVKRYPATSAVATNIAYFHLLDCFATANHTNPLNSLLRLTLDESLFIPAKKRADMCVKDRKTTISHNLTEIFLVSEITYNQLDAKARERHRQDADNFQKVNKMARVMHSAYYTDQFDLVFDKETVAEKADVGQALDGTFSFGCDMSVCKENGKDKGIIVCHFVRGVPKPRRTITKAEANRRRRIELGIPENYGNAKGLIAVGALMISLLLANL